MCASKKSAGSSCGATASRNPQPGASCLAVVLGDFSHIKAQRGTAATKIIRCTSASDDSAGARRTGQLTWVAGSGGFADGPGKWVGRSERGRGSLVLGEPFQAEIMRSCERPSPQTGPPGTGERVGTQKFSQPTRTSNACSAKARRPSGHRNVHPHNVCELRSFLQAGRSEVSAFPLCVLVSLRLCVEFFCPPRTSTIQN